MTIPPPVDRHTADPLVTLQIRLSPSLLERIDAFRKSNTMRPSRSQTIRFLLVNAMSILEEAGL